MAYDYTAMRAAAEARKTLPARLRTAVSATGEASRVMGEAADAIDYYERLVAELRKDMREADRDAHQQIREAASEARWQERESNERGGY